MSKMQTPANLYPYFFSVLLSGNPIRATFQDADGFFPGTVAQIAEHSNIRQRTVCVYNKRHKDFSFEVLRAFGRNVILFEEFVKFVKSTRKIRPDFDISH